jgi:hypothetical protein
MNSTIFQAHNVDTNLKTNLRLLHESFYPNIVPLFIYQKQLVYILINISFCFVVSKKGSFDSYSDSKNGSDVVYFWNNEAISWELLMGCKFCNLSYVPMCLGYQ